MFPHSAEMFIMLPVLLCIGGIVHCIFNKNISGGEKAGWIFFMIFANWIGVAFYALSMLFRSSQNKNGTPVSLPQYNEPRSIPQPEYIPYEQGYRPVQSTSQPVQQFAPERVEQENIEEPLYEQPLVMYPEDPQ